MVLRELPFSAFLRCYKPGCGHSPHIEKQEEVLKLFTGFMESE